MKYYLLLIFAISVVLTLILLQKFFRQKWNKPKNLLLFVLVLVCVVITEIAFSTFIIAPIGYKVTKSLLLNSGADHTVLSSRNNGLVKHCNEKRAVFIPRFWFSEWFSGTGELTFLIEKDELLAEITSSVSSRSYDPEFSGGYAIYYSSPGYFKVQETAGQLGGKRNSYFFEGDDGTYRGFFILRAIDQRSLARIYASHGNGSKTIVVQFFNERGISNIVKDIACVQRSSNWKTNSPN